MARAEEEALYGGAAGGGKSRGAHHRSPQAGTYPALQGTYLAQDLPSFLSSSDKSRKYYRLLSPGCKYNETKHAWTFRAGTHYLWRDAARGGQHKYQGRAFDFIGFDELTHFTYDQYSYLVSRNRPNGAGTQSICGQPQTPAG